MADAPKIEIDFQQILEMHAASQQAIKDLRTLALRNRISAAERGQAAANVEAEANLRQFNEQLIRLTGILADAGFVFDKAVAQRRYEVEPGNVCTQVKGDAYSRTSFATSRMAEDWPLEMFDPKPGTINHLTPGTPRRSEPDHVTSVTVALDCTLVLDVIGVRSDRAEPVAITLRAEGGTAIGVPTVAVDQLRAAGMVL